MKIIIMLGVFLWLLLGFLIGIRMVADFKSGQVSPCQNSTIIVNQTIETIREVNMSCPECITLPSTVIQQNCTLGDDNTLEMSNLRLQAGRYLAEVEYLRNITSTYLSNTTLGQLRVNYTACTRDRDKYSDKLEAIKEVMR